MALTKRAKKLLRPADILTAAAVLLCCGLLLIYLFGGTENTVAVIAVDGVEYRRIPLAEGTRETISIEGEYPLTLLIENRTVCVSHAACPDQVCVRTGRISRAGSGIICLPARVSIQIEGAGTPDGTTY